MDSVNTFITREERRLGRSLRPFTRSLLREFTRFLEDEKHNGRPMNQSSKKTIAFFIQNVGYMTGGRYYAWFLASALVECGYEVTVYTNLMPGFYNNFKDYKMPSVSVISDDPKDLASANIQADIYIGAPIHGAVAASRLGRKYNKPCFALVFDPWPLMEQFLDKTEHKGWYAGWDILIEELRETSIKIISLCDTTTPYIYDWLNKKKEDVFPVPPCINSREMAKVKPQKRGDYVVFASRLAKHKNIDHVLQAIKDNNVRLKIISSTRSQTVIDTIARMGIKKQVDFLTQIGDQEKFRVVSESRALINASTFEGWGIWASEAIATGTPLVCYDYPTIREQEQISGADNIYFATYNDPRDLSEKLGIALKEEKYREWNSLFSFDGMVKRMREVFEVDPKIGVVTIALNEDKFIKASLQSVIKHPSIKKVVVIEGAVKLFSHAASEIGLSVDNTQEAISEVMRGPQGHKILYERYLWAEDKSELRNRALELLPKDITHVLVVDGDEVWKPEDLDTLVQTMRENPNAGMFSFNFLHFWKKKNLIATGGQWNSHLFRCFKYADKSLHWENHGAPVVNAEGKSIDQTDGAVLVKDIHVYHYGAMKEEKRIIEKLEFYKKRDTKLDVKNTWSKWKPGQETQWTHGNGTAEEFRGTHPEELKGII